MKEPEERIHFCRELRITPATSINQYCIWLRQSFRKILKWESKNQSNRNLFPRREYEVWSDVRVDIIRQIFIDVLRKILEQRICPQIVSLEIKWINLASLDASLEGCGQQCNRHKVGLDFFWTELYQCVKVQVSLHSVGDKVMTAIELWRFGTSTGV